jgi:O-antigen ligase
MSVGALVAAVLNTIEAVQVGFGTGLPQVWGAAGGFQGYFQVLGIVVALPRLRAALAKRERLKALAWFAAVILHGFALLLTQTRGAWLAGLVSITVLCLIWRRAMLVIWTSLISAGLLIVLNADWAHVIRERALSVFRVEAALSGYESSVVRVALAATAWNMFVAHPLTGVGLKSFAIALPYYSPAGLPLAVEMGRDQTLVPIEGPHSTYLSLLAETGFLGVAAMILWVATGWLRAYRASRRQLLLGGLDGEFYQSLLGAITVVAVFNLFAEMNASGAVPLTVTLAFAQRLTSDV